MTDDLHKRADDVQERIREWWEYDTGNLMSASADVIAALLARLARAEAALDAVDQVLESRIDQWESDDDLSDWVKPAKIIQADVAAEILAQIEERGE